ncbi:restriction endonuclease subunit S [Bacteroides fragilis]|uniref:restriction endonuclease subunit S n=2 Tax=Bacteroides TaxID=816 RepID=UPI00044AB76A|nr:restriction endonuclease subunit S [Bacteroides fragilis]EXZ16906.1 type I restriction modification DNA specificity domain protein [Bacteroides fragilis str. J-143-4]
MNGKQLKNSILQWAIQGKLVPQDPNDEPASVLLERIRAEKARLVKEKKIKKDKNESIIYRSEDNSYYEKFLATGEVKCIDEEIPFEIPKGWEWTRIGNIFNHTSGKQQSSSNKNGGTPQKFITTSNLYWGYFVLDNVKIMNFTEEEINNCSATKGDLLVCEGGAGYGRSAIWNYDYDICLQNHVHRLRPCVNGICEYVYHFIYLLKESNNLSSVGTAMPGLSANRLKGLLLPFPPLPEQNKIVAKLGELLPQVEKYSKVQNCLDELNVTINDKLKKSILQEAIQGKLVPQIAEEGTAQELLEQIKLEKQKLVKDGKLKKSALTDSIIFKGDDNKYYEQVGKKCLDITEQIPFETPKNWVWTRLSHIANIYTGNSISETEKKSKFTDVIGRYYIGTKDVDFNNRIIYDNGIAIPKQYEPDFRLAPNNSILMCIEGGSAGRKIAILNQDVCFGNKLCCFSPFVGIGKYMYYYLQSPSFFELFNLNKTGIIGGVSIAKVKEILIPLPPIKEQQRIVAQIEKLFEQLR